MVYKKIPFQIGAEIMLRSSSNRSHKAKSKIIGVVNRELILIEKPVFSISDNITVIVDEDLMVAYLHEGYLFTFDSRFGKELIKNIVCIDYPATFQVENLREAPRIKVNLDAAGSVSGSQFTGTIKDLSETGCLLEIPKIVSFYKGVEFTVTFTMPNDQLVKNVQCKIMNMKFNQIYRKTDVGIMFQGPPEEVAKIRELIKFCMRFKV